MREMAIMKDEMRMMKRDSLIATAIAESSSTMKELVTNSKMERESEQKKDKPELPKLEVWSEAS